MIDEYEIEPTNRINHRFTVRVPVEIEIPRAAFELCHWQYEAAQQRGNDPYFPDFLCGLVEPDITYYVEGRRVDEENGELVDEEPDTASNGGEN